MGPQLLFLRLWRGRLFVSKWMIFSFTEFTDNWEGGNFQRIFCHSTLGFKGLQQLKKLAKLRRCVIWVCFGLTKFGPSKLLPQPNFRHQGQPYNLGISLCQDTSNTKHKKALGHMYLSENMWHKVHVIPSSIKGEDGWKIPTQPWH